MYSGTTDQIVLPADSLQIIKEVGKNVVNQKLILGGHNVFFIGKNMDFFKVDAMK